MEQCNERVIAKQIISNSKVRLKFLFTASKVLLAQLLSCPYFGCKFTMKLEQIDLQLESAQLLMYLRLLYYFCKNIYF